MPTPVRTQTFRKVVWEYYQAQGRHDLPWRQPETDGTFDPYKILVSEIMLQQTQVGRVIPKFQEFLEKFPSFTALANAPLGEVLKSWNGLGYNRRAKFLWQAASMVMQEYDGRLPEQLDQLVKLPGVGQNTAGAILAYAYNTPVVFIETNIRTVFIHHFFSTVNEVTDKEIIALVAKTLPDNPRGWYWALMDYGSHLKQTVGNLNQQSRQYTKQSAFHGSRRQIRGKVLRLLAEGGYTRQQLARDIPDDRLPDVLADLTKEGLIVLHPQGVFMLPAI